MPISSFLHKYIIIIIYQNNIYASERDYFHPQYSHALFVPCPISNKCIIIINNMNSIIHSFYLLQYDYDIEEVNDRPS